MSGGIPAAAAPIPMILQIAWYTANSAHISCSTPAGSLLRSTGCPSPMSVLWRPMTVSHSHRAG